ncbi:MAG: hypothetical protein LBD53_04435, partial [Tannerella sp.]|nr:hypothetical protein [Tannerella sp.]
RHCEERSNPEITGLQERQDLQVFIWIASFLAMTNALYVNILAMTWYRLLSPNRLQGLKPLQGFRGTVFP